MCVMKFSLSEDGPVYWCHHCMSKVLEDLASAKNWEEAKIVLRVALRRSGYVE